MTASTRIAAIVAAAGRSTRMGQPKQLLPWGKSTVIRTVANNLSIAGADPLIVVVGHRSEDVIAAMAGSGVQTVLSTTYATTGLLQSFQVGLRTLDDLPHLSGALLCLGDQPHVGVDPLSRFIDFATANARHIVIPRYGGRRGHPIYLPARFIDEVVSLGDDETLRTVVVTHESDIAYVDVDSPGILSDIDTPFDYNRLKPE